MSIQPTLEYLIESKIEVENNTTRKHEINNVINTTSTKLQPINQPEQGIIQAAQGTISELSYCEQWPVLNHILLPLLHQSRSENRWLLWITPNKKVSRQWLVDSGLPLHKSVQLNQIAPVASPHAMEKALESGNYCVVLGWLPELSEYGVQKLRLAAQKGTALGLIMRPQYSSEQYESTENGIKLHSIYYH
ncbi:SOS-induced cell division inhibitor SulA [Xenorhabdus innexi]|uniref:Cell division inhibitor SulA n=1 Tax=Xenorhabdus innexi TaxID=290109 RepID=A0A1N6MVS2_9GAMM|nr:SOS-induced cell division inhibitor SulA [Xenorhabdus innexi]PHM37524.1 phosphatidate cytidylyltransferase [Xenorhabdus innexi]SIP72993.1 Cell division inhibitor SulA [Xenorhabdus innexi]